MNTQLTGQYIPGDSFLHRLDARAKFFGFIFLVAAVIIANSLVGCALMVVITGAIIALSRQSFSLVLMLFQKMWRFYVLIFLLNALFFSAEDPYWQWWIFSLSQMGIIQGASVIFRIIIIMALSSILTQSTPPMELITAIEALLYPLKFIRLPTEDIAIILSVAIQFIPTLMEETDTIRKAQTARGARFESKKLLERAFAMPPLIVPIFLSAFKRADELSMAMEARGYRGAKHRTRKDKTPLQTTGWLAVLFCAAICVAEVLIP